MSEKVWQLIYEVKGKQTISEPMTFEEAEVARDKFVDENWKLYMNFEANCYPSPMEGTNADHSDWD